MAITVKLTGGTSIDAKLRQIMAAASTKANLTVGFQNGATEADGKSVALIAAFNEFGVPSKGQPPRPFMRIAIARGSPNWPNNLAVALKRYNYNAAAALSLVGLKIKEDIEQSIRDLTSPPLAASTIAKKSRGRVRKIAGVLGPAKPLIDSATMLRSVTAVVTTGD